MGRKRERLKELIGGMERLRNYQILKVIIQHPKMSSYKRKRSREKRV